MKPITVDNCAGRTLLALRAGPMTATELRDRVGASPSAWLFKAGYVVQDDSYYYITPAGRAACPYRNPLAAPGAVQPITVKPEIEMPRENVITRQQVLVAIISAGPAGITRKQLIELFDCPEGNMDMHISALNRQLPAVVFKPKAGVVCAIEHQAAPPVPPAPPTVREFATREKVLGWLNAQLAPRTVEQIAEGIQAGLASTADVVKGLHADLKIERAGVVYYVPAAMKAVGFVLPGGELSEATQAEPTPVLTAPELGDLPITHPLHFAKFSDSVAAFTQTEMFQNPAELDQRAPLAISIDDADDFEVGIFSDGTMTFVMDDGLTDACIELGPDAAKKLRTFLGLFCQEAA